MFIKSLQLARGVTGPQGHGATLLGSLALADNGGQASALERLGKFLGKERRACERLGKFLGKNA